MSTSTATTPTTPTVGRTVPAQRARAARPAVAAAPPARPGSVRLTRRGRVVVTLLILGVLFAAFVVFSGRSVASGESGVRVPTRTVLVGEGDTLWGIATEVAEPGTDIREAVHDIEKLNSLPGPALEVGQEIAVPVS